MLRSDSASNALNSGFRRNDGPVLLGPLTPTPLPQGERGRTRTDRPGDLHRRLAHWPAHEPHMPTGRAVESLLPLWEKDRMRGRLAADFWRSA